MNVIKLLEYLEEILDTASKFPLSNKVVVNRKEMMDVITQIMNELPEEFKKAQWVMVEKDRILNDALKQAEEIREKSIQNIRDEVEKHDITMEARNRAEDLIDAAKGEAKNIKLASIEYAYKLLNDVDQQIALRKNAVINKIQSDMEQFAMDIDNDFNGIKEVISENIEELKKIN